MRRRLEEIMFVAQCGYDPLCDEIRGEPLWIKCHAGDVLTHEEALQQIREEGDRRRLARCLDYDHIALVFRSAGERWRAWERVRLEWILKDRARVA
jgi:hypothetical protein